MNELQIFNSEKFGRIRAVERGSEPWFCLADVCKPLDLRVSDCRKRLKPEGVDTINTLTAGGVQGMLYVNEGNLYRAIFQSKKPEAELVWVIFFLNACVAAVSFFVYGWKFEPVIMCLIYCYVSSKISDSIFSRRPLSRGRSGL